MRSRATRLAASAALAALIAAPASAAPIIERVMAIVSGSVITLSDVNAAIGFGLVGANGAAVTSAAALDQVIDRTLMLVEVDRFAPPEPAEALVDARVSELRARFQSPEALARALAAYGMTPERLRAMARDDLRLSAFLDQRFAPLPASDEDVMRYYQEHAQEFTRDGVVVSPQEAAPEIRRRLESARRAELVSDWVRGLRLRAEVSVLYLPGT